MVLSTPYKVPLASERALGPRYLNKVDISNYEDMRNILLNCTTPRQRAALWSLSYVLICKVRGEIDCLPTTLQVQLEHGM